MPFSFMPEKYQDEWKALADSGDFQPADTVYSLCHNCSAIIEENHPEVNVRSLWELILSDESFAYPDFHKQTVLVQDCWRSRERLAEQAAVRDLLKRMNFQVQEMPENHEPFHRQDFFFINYAYTGDYGAQSFSFDNQVVIRENDCYIGQPFSGYALYGASAEDIVIVGVLIRKEVFYRNFLQVISADRALLHFFLDPEIDSFSDEFIHLNNLKDGSIRRQIELMVLEYANRTEDTQRILKPMTLTLIMMLARQFRLAAKNKENEDVIEAMVYFIDEHLDHITLAMLSRRFGYHPAYISAQLSAKTGKTFSRILLSRRMTNGLLFGSFHFLLPTLPIYADHLGATGTELGLIGGIFGFSAIFIRLFTDVGVRVIGKKHCLYAGLFLSILATMSYFIFDSIDAIILARVLHDKAKVTTQLDTMESLAEDDCQVEQLKRLRAYLDRNWEYLVPVKMRGITEELKGLGTCESNHRPFSFRMAIVFLAAWYMLWRMLCSLRKALYSLLVNWHPWSELRICGFAIRRAFLTAAMTIRVSRVSSTSQPTMQRLYQSMMAVR